MAEEKDHDILLEVRRDTCWLKKQIANHLKHHFFVNLALLVAIVGLIISLIRK